MNFSIRNQKFISADTYSITYADNNLTNYKVESVNSIRYLGVTIDSDLSFKKHILDLSSRVRKLMFIFK